MNEVICFWMLQTSAWRFGVQHARFAALPCLLSTPSKRHQTRQATPTRLFIWSDPVPQQFLAHVTHMQHTYNIIQRTFSIFNSHHGSNGSRRFASSALRCTGQGYLNYALTLCLVSLSLNFQKARQSRQKVEKIPTRHGV